MQLFLTPAGDLNQLIYCSVLNLVVYVVAICVTLVIHVPFRLLLPTRVCRETYEFCVNVISRIGVDRPWMKCLDQNGLRLGSLDP